MVEALIAVLVILVVAIAIVLALALGKPATFEVQRSVTIGTPPEKIFPMINDFRRWSAWSPYEHKDPDMKRTYSGASAGKGAIYEWSGKKDVGSGRMEIINSSAPDCLLITLDFSSPFEAHNIAEFTMLPQGSATRVTWAMRGPASLMSKIMQVFMNLDRMVGKDFEVGLANLKNISERS